jgi:hypothetical protein
METDFRQYILLATAILIPFLLIRLKRTDLLLGWVCVTLFIQIFDTSLLTNLPAGRIVGLMLLPSAIARAREWLRFRAVQAWTINYLYLIVIGVAFGFLWPWPDITMTRGFTLTAPGRTIVYSVRLLSDISLTIFVASEILRAASLRFLGRAMALGTTISALAGLVSFFARVDFYFLITGLGVQALDIGRVRGLVGEPRALGLCCAYGIMILATGQRRLFLAWPVMLAINLAGLLMTYSASSLALLVAGFLVTWLFFSNRERLIALGVAGLAGVLIVIGWLFFPEQIDFARLTLGQRLDPDLKLLGIPPGTFGEEIAYRLDVFDASALLFLLDQPWYALIGAGPGLVSLPASYYVPPGLYSAIWTPEVGINSLPFHGLLLETSNSGLPGLLLWFAQVIACWIALRAITTRLVETEEEAADWNFGYALFLIGAAFYVVQVSYTPVWNVLLAIGWAAVRLAEPVDSPAASHNQVEEWLDGGVVIPQRGNVS